VPAVAPPVLVNDDIDYLIIGGGIAGLRAAIALAPSGRVLILTKAEAAESNTGYAQGGIAAALGAEDSPALHAADTIRAGDGLCDEEAVRVLVDEGPRYVRELVDWGADFDRDAAGQLTLGLEAAHSARRILHAGDATGREIARAMSALVATLPSVQRISHALVTELLVEDGVVAGVRFFDRDGRRRDVRARATLLATGGAGQVFRETTNPGVATGDGVALAYHAGARVTDLEFVQFHPTALNLPGTPRFLISEALRGEGARLVNGEGDPFMARYHAAGDLAPRDVVARAIVREGERAGPIFLTLAHLDQALVRTRFPTIAEMCRQIGLDLATDPIPVGPAAHYVMGGIETDTWGRASLPGLFAAGETACTGVHGANRLASNSLLEGLVFGARAAQAMTGPPRAMTPRADRRLATPASTPGGLASGKTLPDSDAVRDLMWRDVGLFRTRATLEPAVSRLTSSYLRERRAIDPVSTADAGAWRRFNLLTVAWLIARAALRREESRGGHFREDFPARDDLHWQIHLVDTR
jgi:L-aspartate oxidase